MKIKLIAILLLVGGSGAVFWLSSVNHKEQTLYENSYTPMTASNKTALNSGEKKPVANASKNTAMIGILKPDTEQSEIATALNNVYSEDVNLRVHSMQTLLAKSPQDAAAVIQELLAKLGQDPMAEGMVAMGLLSLANNPEAFPDTDLHYIFNSYTNDNIRSRAARVLAHRGDDSLLSQYVKKYDTVQPTDIQGKNKAIMELANMQSRVTVPYLSKYLQDENHEVRLLALGALDMSANQNDLDVIKPLINDSNPDVRRLSMEVMNNLMERGKAEPVPIDILLHPAPGAG